MRTRANNAQAGTTHMIHPTGVAQSLADLRLDIPSIVTGLLHDTVEDTHADVGGNWKRVWKRHCRARRRGHETYSDDVQDVGRKAGREF